MNPTHDHLIRYAEEGYTQIQEVTPEIAEQYLVRNTKNRSKKTRQIEVWARSMAAGRWRLTGESVKFSKEGQLLDGQNRLLAVVKSGATVMLSVTYGLEGESQDVMDSGSRRSASDALELRGEVNSKAMQAAVMMIFTEGGRSRRAAAHDELLDLVAADPSIREIVSNILPSLKLNPLLPPAVQFYAYWTLNQVHPGKTHAFFQALATLEGLGKGSPILAMHRRLSRMGGSGKGSHSYRQEALAVIFSAWNAWVKGEERSKIQLHYGEFGRLSVPTPVTPEAEAVA